MRDISEWANIETDYDMDRNQVFVFGGGEGEEPSYFLRYYLDRPLDDLVHYTHGYRPDRLGSPKVREFPIPTCWQDKERSETARMTIIRRDVTCQDCKEWMHA